MSEIVTFTNKETKKDISIDLKTKFVIIYGKNGSGKTTFSRSSCFENGFVFNTDFIHKNIYVESDNGATESAENKKQFSSLWVCEEIVKKKQEIAKLKSISKNIDESCDKLISKIKGEFSEKRVAYDISHVDKIIDFKKASIPLNNDWLEYIKTHKRNSEIKSPIKDKKEFEAKLAQLNENGLLLQFIGLLKKDKFLTSLILDKKCDFLDKLSDSINNYNISLDELKKCETAFSKKYKNEHKEWIKNGLELHKKAISKTCMFCGNDNIENAQKRWNEILKSNISKSKDDILSNLANTINVSKSIFEQKNVYKKVCKNTLVIIDYILEDFPKRIDDIKENKKVNSSFKQLIERKKDDFVTDQAELLKSVQIHLLDPYIDQYEAHVLLKVAYKDNIKTKEQALKSELEKSAAKISDSINKKLIELGYDRELKIKIDSRGGESKYSFSFVDTSVDIAKLSDGQKHKLALAVFLVKLENHVGKINCIVLDDPVVTLDFQTYYRVKKEIVNLVKNDDIEHVILLTYNISFLFIQLSNLFNSSDISICTLYHLNPNSCNVVDPNVLNYDDLVLYKKCLLLTQTPEEFNILSFMNFRIMRIFIDMKARLLGIPDSGLPSNAILSLTCFDDKTKKNLQQLASKITKIYNNKESKNSDLYESFVLLKEFAEKMNFGNFLSDDNLNFLQKFSNSEKRCSNYSGDNLLFLIIQWAFKVEHSNSPIMSYIKNYIHHPRNQLTNSVIGIDFTDSDGNFINQP